MHDLNKLSSKSDNSEDKHFRLIYCIGYSPATSSCLSQANSLCSHYKKSVVGLEMGPKSGSISLQSQMHSFAAWVVVTYLALAVDRVTSSCLCEAQEMVAPSMRKVKPDIT
jgi:hypothetical protein